MSIIGGSVLEKIYELFFETYESVRCIRVSVLSRVSVEGGAIVLFLFVLEKLSSMARRFLA